MRKYDPIMIERKHQQRWYSSGLYEIGLDSASQPFYNLMMFPYPSAEGLHVGNVYAFTGADIYGRFQAMLGRDVLEPIGYDAFGIHSENFAIKMNQHPKTLIAHNIAHFREQLKAMGGRFAWSREVDSTNPDYYKWTQWIFLQLYKAGLAEKKRAPVNWCPSCKTVLADEQVVGGECERCGTQIVLQELEQWFFKITKYSQRLLDNLDSLDWSEVIKTAQRNWIGRSNGAEVEFQVSGASSARLKFFTTRPDTMFGVTFMVLAPENPLVERITLPEFKNAVQDYMAWAKGQTEFSRIASKKEKTGVFTGAYAINPLNKERLPIWIADYVLMKHGTGAIMAVPAHDQRDFEFARKFDLPIRVVISPPTWNGEPLEEAYAGPGRLVNSGIFTGLASEDATRAVTDYIQQKGLGNRKTTYRLRDWLISRQRYWGPPIPILYCDSCGTMPVPEDQLPVLLPMVEDFKPKGTGKSPLAEIYTFVSTTCPYCGGHARRETDVSDNFLDSAWYFLRYPSTEFRDRPFDTKRTRKWLPVDMYIGGKEHAVLHLLYVRFICMALHDIGLIDFEEPFKRFYAHGVITREGAKMSKSRGNTVDPDKYFQTCGADTFRTYLMFMGPYNQGGDFSDAGINGISRFLQRVWDICLRFQESKSPGTIPIEAQRAMHRTIKKVTEDIAALKYNTAIAHLMEYSHSLVQPLDLQEVESKTLLLLLAPFAPHITEELWEILGYPYSIHAQAWPSFDPQLAEPEKTVIAVQIDGKTREVIEVELNTNEEGVRQVAMSLDKVRRHLEGKQVRRVVYVPGRLMNFVT